MKITVILKDFTEEFFNGYESYSGPVVGLLQMTNLEKFTYCKKLSFDKRATMKIESGQSRDAVELNSLMRNPVNIEFKLEPRRGYKLATFEIKKA